MATEINKVYTLPEILKQRAPDGSIMPLIDVLSGKYPIIEEAYWEQANGDIVHEFAQVAYEPTGTPVRYNEGTALSASVAKTLREPLMTLEDRLQIDVRELEVAPDPVQFRIQREQVHFRGMIKTFHNIVFSKAGYGDMGVDPRQIDGLSKRFNSIKADSVVSLPESPLGTTNSSIWVVKWGMDGVSLLYPSRIGNTLRIEDLRVQPAFDSQGRRFEAVMTKFSWTFGLKLGDPRAVKRLCNIPLTGTGSFNDGAAGEEALIDLIESLPGGDTTGVVIYVGPKIMAQIRKRINSKANLFFTEETVWGRNMITFQGIPVVRVDSLAADESVVS